MQNLAVINHEVLSSGPYVAHAVIPLKESWTPLDPTADLASIISVFTDDGTALKTQTEPVAYSKDGRIDAVEVLAYISEEQRQKFSEPTTKLYVRIASQEQDSGLPLGHTAYLLSSDFGILVRAETLTGEVYWASLGVRDFQYFPKSPTKAQPQYEKQGSCLTTYRFSGELQNKGNVLMSHLTWITFIPGRNAVEVVFNPHLCDVNRPLPDAYFKKLEILVPSSWRLLPTVANKYFNSIINNKTAIVELPNETKGEYRVYSLAGEQPNGHMLRQLGQFEFRFSLVHMSEDFSNFNGLTSWCMASDEGGKQLDYLSFFNPACRGFSAQNAWLGRTIPVDQAVTYVKNKHAEITEALRKGLPYPPDMKGAAAFGFYHMYSPAYGGVTGGVGIEQSFGIPVAEAGSNYGLTWYMAMQSMIVARQFGLLIDDNNPIRSEDWLDSEGRMTWKLFSGGFIQGQSKPFNFPSADISKPVINGVTVLPDYYATLKDYSAVDTQHMIRLTSLLKTLAWLANDPVAKFKLRCVAECTRMEFSDIPRTNGMSDVKEREIIVAKSPAGCLPAFGRGEAWTLDSIANAYILHKRSLVSHWDSWLTRVGALAIACQSEAGIFQGAIEGKIASDYGYNYRYRVVQSYEHGLMTYALIGLMESILGEKFSSAGKTLKETIFKAILAVPRYLWKPKFGGCWYNIAAGPSDYSLPAYSSISEVPEDGKAHAYPWVEIGELLNIMGYGLYKGDNELKKEIFDKLSEVMLPANYNYIDDKAFLMTVLSFVKPAAGPDKL